MQKRINFPDERNPSNQLLLRIYAFSLRSLETNPELEPVKLCERIKNRYGITLTEKELLTLLNKES